MTCPCDGSPWNSCRSKDMTDMRLLVGKFASAELSAGLTAGVSFAAADLFQLTVDT